MGNLSSCCFYLQQKQKARVVDVYGNVRDVKLPMTAAEMMLLEQPGHLISPVVLQNSNFRLSALPADEELTKGKLYMLIPSTRLNSFITQSELQMLHSLTINNKKKRRRSSKVLPQQEQLEEKIQVESSSFGRIIGITTTSPMWKPVLEPIYEQE